MLRLFKHYLSLQTMLLVAVESAIIFVAIHYIDRYVYEWIYSATPLRNYSILTSVLYSVVLMLFMTGFGLYYGRCLIDRKLMMGRVFFSFVTGTLVLTLIYVAGASLFAEHSPTLHPSIAATMTFAVASVVIVRFIVLGMASHPLLRRRVLIVGRGPQVGQIQKAVDSTSRYRVDALLSEKLVPSPVFQLAGGAAQTVLPFVTINQPNRVHEVVVAGELDRAEEQALLEYRLSGVPVTDYLSFWERVTGRVDIDALSASWLIYSDGFRIGGISGAMKRGFDLAVSLAFLFATLPLMALVAVAIKLDSRGPVFYRQQRVGLNGRVFEVIKFRSMTTDAESAGTPRWAAANDSRVTRVGSFIRKTRLDEIPQVFNVIRGDMSFIGPRPERPYFVEQLRKEIPYYDLRHRVRPGITGWAQVNYPYGASVEDAKAKQSYDLYYMKNYSLFLDVLILIETVRVVLTSDGAR